MPIKPGQLNISGPIDIPPKECEGVNCFRTFIPTFHKMRRCDRCRKEGRDYRKVDEPF